jgi:hypothetical protein
MPRSMDLPLRRIEVLKVAALIAALGLLAPALGGTAAAQTKPLPLAVEVANASEPEICAEKDNVTVTFASAELRRFRIEAAHPAYIGGVTGESREPDWTDCDIPHGDASPPQERRVTFYESPFLWVTGYEFSDYWRKRDVPVRIGDHVEHNLTMLQLWVFVRGKAEQILVLYPTDGIWRIHPLPPANLPWVAYGSSFLVGPLERKERLLVDIDEIAFDPATRTFHLAFSRGGKGDVRLADLDEDRIALEVAFDHGFKDQPFAALRSMYVTEFNADAAHIALQIPDARGWLEQSIMNFRSATATKAWIGRLVPSRHNISAPDLVFSGFTSGLAP